MPNTVECASQSEATRRPARRFEIVDSCEIGSRSNQDESIELWYPIIPDNPYQRVLDVSISAPPSWAMCRELEHGNLMLYAKSRNSIGKEPRIQIRYLVERAAVSHAINLANVRPLETPALFERWLRAERFVDVDAKTRALAREIVGAETNVLFQARVIYHYVTGAMTYDAAQQSWKGQHRARTGVLGWELQRHPRTFHLALPFCGNPTAVDFGSSAGSAPPWPRRLRSLRLPLLGGVLRLRPRLGSGRRLLRLQVWQASPVRRSRNESRCLVGRQRHRTKSAAKGRASFVFRRALHRNQWRCPTGSRAPCTFHRSLNVAANILPSNFRKEFRSAKILFRGLGPGAVGASGWSETF